MDDESRKYKELRKSQLTDTKSKIQFFWDYYKVHTLVVVILVAFVSSYIYTIATRKDVNLYVALTGRYINTEKLDNFKKDKTKDFVNDEKKEEIILEFLDMDANDAAKVQSNQASIMKLQAICYSGELDVLLLDKDMFKNYIRQGYFKPLDDLPIYEELKKKNVDFLDGVVKDSDTGSRVYGVSAEKSKLLKDLGYELNDKYIGIIVKSSHDENAQKFIKKIFE